MKGTQPETRQPTIADGYRSSSRLATTGGPHHMTSAARNHPDVEARLRQTSLYRPDLDLVVHTDDGAVAAYGLFWYDPVTDTGLVEPMRTEDDHQRRGLARHVLTRRAALSPSTASSPTLTHTRLLLLRGP